MQEFTVYVIVTAVAVYTFYLIVKSVTKKRKTKAYAMVNAAVAA